ncbi:MAG: hypothetical protein HWE27_06045 [Gammaproteobacteria bacterium]|nr:hypothetical protein [Gammaproteobacteria bacterium]
MNKIKHLFNHIFLVASIVCSLALVGLTENETPHTQKLVEEKSDNKAELAQAKIQRCT